MKSGEDYRDITVAAFAVIVFLLTFTSLFHGLRGLSISVYGAIMIGLIVAGIIVNRRQALTDLCSEKLGSESSYRWKRKFL